MKGFLEKRTGRPEGTGGRRRREAAEGERLLRRCCLEAALEGGGTGLGSRAGARTAPAAPWELQDRLRTAERCPEVGATPAGKEVRAEQPRRGRRCGPRPRFSFRAGRGGAKMAAAGWLWRRLCQVRCAAGQGTRECPLPPLRPLPRRLHS